MRRIGQQYFFHADYFRRLFRHGRRTISRHQQVYTTQFGGGGNGMADGRIQGLIIVFCYH